MFFCLWGGELKPSFSEGIDLQTSAPGENSSELNGEKQIHLLQETEDNKQLEGDRTPSSRAIKKTTIKRDRRFKIPTSKKPIRKKKRMSLRSIQPPSTDRIYYQGNSDEAELERVINEEIQQLFRLLKKNRSANLTLRLGSLYVEKARFISFKIQLDHDLKMEAFKAGRLKTKPRLNLRPAQVYNKKSLKLFEDFRQSYPQHKRMDEVLFFLGFNFYQLENEERGIQYFSELEKLYPKSLYLYEARFQLGEHYFRLRQWKLSFNYYSKVARNKRGKFYFFALYKMAWSSYKMGQTGKGLSLLEKIIREERQFKARSDRDEIFTFKNEAIQDLVLFYTHSNRSPARAKTFFLQLIGEDQAWPLLKKLAQAYHDIGHTQGVFILFEELIQKDPLGVEAVNYKYQIVETTYNFGKTSEIVRQIREWVRGYGPDSAWFKTHRDREDLIKKSLNFQEVTVSGYALKNHNTFNRTQSPKSKTLALSIYKIYFDHFKSSPSSDKMHYFYGDLLFDAGKYSRAARSYEEVIARFPNSKYAKPAFTNQILALERILPKEKQIQLLTKNSKKRVEFPNSIKAFVKAAGRYVVRWPKEKNAPSILYKISALHYKFHQLTMAAKLFKKLSNEYPKSKLAGDVNGILLDIYNKNKDYKSLEELARKLAQNKNANRELLKEAQSILEQISFKKAQDLALIKKYEESARLYEKFARTYPGSTLTNTAFYNAGLNFEKGGDSLKALSMYSAVLSDRSRRSAKIRRKSQEFLAVLSEKLAFYRKSAKAYVSFAKSYPSSSKSSDFWYNAGVIFDGLNDKASAVYAYKQYLSLSRKSDRYEVLFLMALMFEKSRRWNQAIEYYQSYLKSPSSNKLRLVRASFAVADIYERRLRNPTQAKVWHEKTLSLYKRLRVGVSYGARSHFYIAQKFYDRFAQVRVPADPKKQSLAVAKKLKLLTRLEKAFQPIIRYDDGEQIISALSLIGQANQEMAQAIYKAPIPKGLDKKGQAQYREGIKKLVDPYIKKAIKHYQLSLKKSAELQIYSKRLGKAYSGLASIQLSGGSFQQFLPSPPAPEILSLQLLDNAGTVERGFIQNLETSLKYGLSRSDFENLSQAIAQKREDQVLKAVSGILNKDSRNVLAINSLAFFYLRNNRWGLGTLVLNRVASKKSKAPVIMNNLAIVSLKYGHVREAVNYLKKALAVSQVQPIAHANLANIFLQQNDYRNAYIHYRSAHKLLMRKWPAQDQRRTAFLNNYGVALTWAKKWSTGELVFSKLMSSPSPLPEVLFNYAVFLTEKSKREDRDSSKKSLLRAKSLVEELLMSSTSSQRLKGKAKTVLKLVSQRLKQIKTQLKTQQGREK